jgi:ribulose-5-phosphate 4-epimerase/fuculose-1-phosphate aldolase
MAHNPSYDEYKKEVLTCSRWLLDHGFFGVRLGAGGNLTIRIPGEDRLVITPPSVHYLEISNREIVRHIRAHALKTSENW